VNDFRAGNYCLVAAWGKDFSGDGNDSHEEAEGKDLSPLSQHPPSPALDERTVQA
jgi:hypothetical protein